MDDPGTLRISTEMVQSSLFRGGMRRWVASRHHLGPDRDSQSPEWGAFDGKFKILASAWSSSYVASVFRHVKLETAVVF
jgi:hypothetical protein